MFDNFNNLNLLFERKLGFLCFFSLIVLLIFSFEFAYAHKVTIFAWVEGDTVHTKCKFSGGRKAQNSTVVVYDKGGNQLLEGKTDENGEFSFKIPKKTKLKIVLKASMGHMAEWTIPAEEIISGGNESENNFLETATEGTIKKPLQYQTGITAEKVESVPATLHLERQELQKMIDTSLDKKLKPITNMLADSMEKEPRLSEILGGIGYIFGLVGVAFHFSNRRRKD